MFTNEHNYFLIPHEQFYFKEKCTFTITLVTASKKIWLSYKIFLWNCHFFVGMWDQKKDIFPFLANDIYHDRIFYTKRKKYIISLTISRTKIWYYIISRSRKKDIFRDIISSELYPLQVCLLLYNFENKMTTL